MTFWDFFAKFVDAHGIVVALALGAAIYLWMLYFRGHKERLNDRTREIDRLTTLLENARAENRELLDRMMSMWDQRREDAGEQKNHD